MTKVVISDEAESDLIEIWAYIAEDNPEAADALLARVHDACQLLARTPGIGRDRSDLKRGLRSHPVATYLIFYRRKGQQLQVVRVLSGYRDLPRLFS